MSSQISTPNGTVDPATAMALVVTPARVGFWHNSQYDAPMDHDGGIEKASFTS